MLHDADVLFAERDELRIRELTAFLSNPMVIPETGRRGGVPWRIEARRRDTCARVSCAIGAAMGARMVVWPGRALPYYLEAHWGVVFAVGRAADTSVCRHNSTFENNLKLSNLASGPAAN